MALVEAPGGLRAVDERGRRLPLDPSKTPVDAPVVRRRRAIRCVFHLLGADAARSTGAVRPAQLHPRAPARTRSCFRSRDLSVRAMTNVTLARLGDIDPVQRDLARASARVRRARSPFPRPSDRQIAMNPERLVAGLDIGSAKTTAIIAEVVGDLPSTRRSRCSASGQARTTGLRRGVVSRHRGDDALDPEGAAGRRADGGRARSPTCTPASPASTCRR